MFTADATVLTSDENLAYCAAAFGSCYVNAFNGQIRSDSVYTGSNAEWRNYDGMAVRRIRASGDGLAPEKNALSLFARQSGLDKP